MEKTHLITLAGGKIIKDFHNRICPICGKAMHCEVICRRKQAGICQEHCADQGNGKPCPWYVSIFQHCRYKERT